MSRFTKTFVVLGLYAFLIGVVVELYQDNLDAAKKIEFLTSQGNDDELVRQNGEYLSKLHKAVQLHMDVNGGVPPQQTR